MDVLRGHGRHAALPAVVLGGGPRLRSWLRLGLESAARTSRQPRDLVASVAGSVVPRRHWHATAAVPSGGAGAELTGRRRRAAERLTRWGPRSCRTPGSRT